MTDNISSSSLVHSMRPEIARQRIETFRQRFKEPHFYFILHAAFPLALTPDLLYRLWANFQRDIQDEKIKVPWIAVADLLLSPLCEEIDVGYELYEMDLAVRALLLNDLQANSKFGKKRINELSSFLEDYARQQLKSSDPILLDTAQGQRWTALAYTRPGEVARELARALTALYQKDSVEQVRLASLMETLGAIAEPIAALEGFAPLLAYARGIANSILGKEDNTQVQTSSASIAALASDMEQEALARLVEDWIQFTEEKWRTVSDSQLGWKPLRGRWSSWDDLFQDTYTAKTFDPAAEANRAARESTARRFDNSQNKGSAASAVVCFIRDIMTLQYATAIILSGSPSTDFHKDVEQRSLASVVRNWIQFTEEKWRTVSDSQLNWKPLRGRWSSWDDIFNDVYLATASSYLVEAVQRAEEATARRFDNSQDKGSAASAVVCFIRDMTTLHRGLSMLEGLNDSQFSLPTPTPPVSTPPRSTLIRRRPTFLSEGIEDESK